ncbi:MAG: hypothetical protein MUC56_17680 [Thermoanaerobaculales bacterium]|jgi:hypothetical protein|nr:hypothetical protein [Thermoanaerobaculales bacterium]
MARTSTVVWSLVGIVLVILALLGAVYGPGLVRQGRSLVGPIVDIAQTEERLAALDRELGFTPPADGVVPAERLEVFLEIRRALRPRYLEWEELARTIERRKQEDWEAAMEALGAVREVMTFQIDTLRSHGMAPAEFIWIEDLVYDAWAPKVDEAIRAGAVDDALRAATSDDLAALTELERRHGASPATRELADRLRRRLGELGAAGPPRVEGVSEANSALFWGHREAIRELDFAALAGLHRAIRGSENVDVEIG